MKIAEFLKNAANWRGRKLRARVAKVAMMTALIVAITPAAYAGCDWIDDFFNTINPILLITQAMQRLQLGFFAAAFSTGQLMQSKIEQNNSNALSASNRSTAQAKIAGDIAKDFSMPKDFSYCKQGKSVSSAAAATRSAEAMGRTMAGNAYKTASLKTMTDEYSKKLKDGGVTCTPGRPDYAANKAMGCTASSREGSASVIAAVTNKMGYHMPDNVSLNKPGTFAALDNVSDEDKDFADAYRQCQGLMPVESPNAGKATPSSAYPQLYQQARHTIFNGAASSICMYAVAMHAKGGPLLGVQKTACQADVDANHADSMGDCASKGRSSWETLAMGSYQAHESAAYQSKYLRGADAQLQQMDPQTAAMQKAQFDRLRKDEEDVLNLALILHDKVSAPSNMSTQIKVSSK